MLIQRGEWVIWDAAAVVHHLEPLLFERWTAKKSILYLLNQPAPAFGFSAQKFLLSLE